MYQDGIAESLADYYDQSGNRSLAVQLLSEGGLSHLWQSISGILRFKMHSMKKLRSLRRPNRPCQYAERGATERKALFRAK